MYTPIKKYSHPGWWEFCLKSFVRLAARVAARASHVAVERFGKLAKSFFFLSPKKSLGCHGLAKPRPQGCHEEGPAFQ